MKATAGCTGTRTGAVAGGEFSLIDRYFRRSPLRGDVLLGVGDDAAAMTVPPGRTLLTCTDTLVEGVHFPAGTDASVVGHKALAVNLSDLAAMGADPHWAQVAITLPSADEPWLKGFADGLLGLASRFGVDVVGGDTTRGPLSVTVQALGTVAGRDFVRRAGARAGDALYVTGTPGDAALALCDLLGTIRLDEASHKHCRSRLDRPEPRIEAGMRLAGFASAAIDVSDGLVADLAHVLAESGGAGAEIRLDALPMSGPVRAQVHGGQGDRDWTLPLAGGDDYELLFTVDPGREAELAQRLTGVGHPVTRIGRIVSHPGIRFLERDAERGIDPGPGYDHFR